MERAIKYLVKRHRAADAADQDETLKAARAKQIKTLKASVAKVKGFLEGARRTSAAPRASVVKSNITDNDSAKIKTGKGVIQGYDAMAVVDAKHQVIVGAQAFGAGQEHALLIPMLEHTRESFDALGDHDVLKGAALLADSGLHSEANLEYLFAKGIDGYVADTRFRKRDPRFATAERHRPTAPGCAVGKTETARAVHAEGLPARPATPLLYLPGGQAALPQRRQRAVSR